MGHERKKLKKKEKRNIINLDFLWPKTQRRGKRIKEKELKIKTKMKMRNIEKCERDVVGEHLIPRYNKSYNMI